MLAQISYKIPFHDTDGLGIIWYGNYYKYFELVRNKLFQKIKFDIKEWKRNKITLVITESNCKYIKSLKYNDEIRISAFIEENMYRLKIKYKIHKGKILVATGYTVQVAIKENTQQLLSKLPKILREKF